MHTDGSNFIALGSKDRKVRFIDCETAKEVGPLIIGHAGSIRCCYLLKDKGKVLSGSYDTSVRYLFKKLCTIKHSNVQYNFFKRIF